MGVCNCSMFCCTLLYVHSSIAIILMGKRELVALLNLSSWCLVMVERLFLAVPLDCLRIVIVVFSDHTHLLFLHVSLLVGTLYLVFLSLHSPCSLNRNCLGQFRGIPSNQTSVYIEDLLLSQYIQPKMTLNPQLIP